MRRRGDPVSGWVVLDKPYGMGSTTAVAAIRRLFNARKAGHGGTLDPLATGILPIALGEATKTVAWAMDGVKRYRVTVRWGVATDSDDREGAVVATSTVRPDAPSVAAALPAFTGEISQVPPAFSAIKVAGRRAYGLARAARDEGREFPAMAPRIVRVDALTLTPSPDPDHAVLEVACGKGTYIRSLARDLALSLGTVGHVADLRRLQVGAFDEDRAICLEKLQSLSYEERLSEHLLPIETALDDVPALALTEAEARRLRLGQTLPFDPGAPRHAIGRFPIGSAAGLDFTPGSIVRAMADGKLVALAEYATDGLRPVRVLNL